MNKDTVVLDRDDAYWLLSIARDALRERPEIAIHKRLERIAGALDAQPIRKGRPAEDPRAYDLFVLVEENSLADPIAVDTDLERIQGLQAAYNLASARTGGSRAEILGYTTGAVGVGVRIEE